ncbi:MULTISPECIES: nucleotidyltransferase domain-containing protein [unclassified Streptomyces]|uniref:nucleotidyltransferase domain-containing protein n=1 Tax=unclassified Streptomyces TaxID=2593676 RepID=UPI00088A8713|nr:MULTISPECIES: nucleotidyltransferase domain-containing protein [unclassified Streptomyces]PBC85565.1 nucleotidyltransferase-like protein [Streptomyces sp. 2321.6]SDR11813.1 Nucleotidyltransferase domain-containing protein [Streptomyces sp. KS_16]SED72068.1 Nucleotidyltransferase domain-containing protein [Streptomyces sp. 2133.1]SEE09043.1 Nucleotidyltransferase domain-containing protein [Streptomyces sp. 2112.3]SNC72133.1 Nucleotidyltransferase domain-containing protein [Streptomyces sp. 2
MNDQETVEDRALRLVTERFPHAVGALLGGSAAQGRATPTSDLDIAVLLPDGDTSRREVIRHDGFLAELFLHTVTDIPAFFAWDRARRRGTVLFLYDQGLMLTDPHGHVARTRERARAVIAAGPPPLTPEEWERGRYILTCYLDDLADTPPANRYEQLSLADHALREATHLVTAYHGAWTGIGKWLPRRLLSADPARGRALLDGQQAVAEHADPMPMVAAVQQVLDLIGGALREGYTQSWGT